MPLLDADARLLRDHGIVREQWQSVGEYIAYVRSEQERGGWNIPGPLNLIDEEEVNEEQDDLVVENETDARILEERAQQHLSQYRRYFYRMDFSLELPYEDDTVWLAYARPYPYSQVIAHMFQVEEKLAAFPGCTIAEGGAEGDDDGGFSLKITHPNFVYERDLLCKTISGLPVPKIYLTACNKPAVKPHLPWAKREAIFVTARVHPGETNASTVFEGFFDRLTDNADRSLVLANYVLRLIPCMNPDGVVCGNYRSSLAGVDLNRQWILPSLEMHPEVFHTKSLMHLVANVQGRKILIYCDIHCHSKKVNSFLYGCNVKEEGASFSTWTQVRLLPRLLARRSMYFNLPSCRFAVESCKLGTARVVVWKEFQVMNSFTLENSFYGYDHGPETKIFEQEGYRELG